MVRVNCGAVVGMRVLMTQPGPMLRVTSGGTVRVRVAAGPPPVGLRVTTGPLLPGDAVTMELDGDGLNLVVRRRDGSLAGLVPWVPVT